MLLLLDFFFYEYYYFCSRCTENIEYSSECFQCSKQIIFNGLNIASDEETLNQIIYNKKSISRFGDGEFELIFGHNISFQDSNKILSHRLKEILNNTDNNYLVGINIPYKDIYKLNIREKKFWNIYLNINKFKFIKVLILIFLL